jgi:hypothetical protein
MSPAWITTAISLACKPGLLCNAHRKAGQLKSGIAHILVFCAEGCAGLWRMNQRHSSAEMFMESRAASCRLTDIRVGRFSIHWLTQKVTGWAAWF